MSMTSHWVVPLQNIVKIRSLHCIHSILLIYVVFGCSVKCFWTVNAEMYIKTLRFTGAYFDRRMFGLPFRQLSTEYYGTGCIDKVA